MWQSKKFVTNSSKFCKNWCSSWKLEPPPVSRSSEMGTQWSLEKAPLARRFSTFWKVASWLSALLQHWSWNTSINEKKGDRLGFNHAQACDNVWTSQKKFLGFSPNDFWIDPIDFGLRLGILGGSHYMSLPGSPCRSALRCHGVSWCHGEMMWHTVGHILGISGSHLEHIFQALRLSEEILLGAFPGSCGVESMGDEAKKTWSNRKRWVEWIDNGLNSGYQLKTSSHKMQ